MFESHVFKIVSEIREKNKQEIGETRLDGEARDQECQAGGQHLQLNRVTDISVQALLSKDISLGGSCQRRV